VLSLLLAARLSQPTALVNVAAWAETTGADLLWGVPAGKLNDDRLGRSLDAFFEQRHSIQAALTHQALRLVDAGSARRPFHPTPLIFYGAYDRSAPRPGQRPEELRGDGQLPPAHIRHGYLSRDRMLQVGVTALVDDLGALPVLGHALDGNRNGFTAIRAQY